MRTLIGSALQDFPDMQQSKLSNGLWLNTAQGLGLDNIVGGKCNLKKCNLILGEEGCTTSPSLQIH
jgi:hypothetical protein